MSSDHGDPRTTFHLVLRVNARSSEHIKAMSMEYKTASFRIGSKYVSAFAAEQERERRASARDAVQSAIKRQRESER